MCNSKRHWHWYYYYYYYCIIACRICLSLYTADCSILTEASRRKKRMHSSWMVRAVGRWVGGWWGSGRIHGSYLANRSLAAIHHPMCSDLSLSPPLVLLIPGIQLLRLISFHRPHMSGSREEDDGVARESVDVLLSSVILKQYVRTGLNSNWPYFASAPTWYH